MVQPSTRLGTTLVCALLALLSTGCARSGDAPRVRNGGIDLSSWDFESHGPVALVGDWEICWAALVDPATGQCPRGWQPFPVPRLWSDTGVESPIGGQGVASYRLRIALPPDAAGLMLRAGGPMTAHRLWIDGALRGGAGTVGTSADTTVPKLADRSYALSDGADHVDVLVHVANFHLRGGGLRRPWSVGRRQDVATQATVATLRFAVFGSVCFAIGLFFLGQFASRRQERARGWFGAMTALMGLRILSANTSDLYELAMGWASFDLAMRIEYLNTALLIFVGTGYIRAKIPGVMPPRLTQAAQIAALVLVPIIAIAPLSMALATLPVILALPPFVVVLTVASYGSAYRRGVPGAGTTVLAALLFSVGIVHDVVRTQTGFGAPLELFPFFVVVWIAVEAGTLLQSFSRALSTVESLSDQLQDANFELHETEEAVARFVPSDLLRVLGKESIRDVRAGDRAEAEMAVMSCRIELGDAIGTSAAFDHLGRLVRLVENAIRSHGGFVSQHLGSEIVALFPIERAKAADSAATDVRRVVEAYGEGARASLGVAQGSVLLGTVGSDRDLACVALGPAVDEAQARQARDREESR